ncbi:unnamed protein product, partial [Amoebophrya sp. A120]
ASAAKRRAHVAEINVADQHDHPPPRVTINDSPSFIYRSCQSFKDFTCCKVVLNPLCDWLGVESFGEGAKKLSPTTSSTRSSSGSSRATGEEVGVHPDGSTSRAA